MDNDEFSLNFIVKEVHKVIPTNAYGNAWMCKLEFSQQLFIISNNLMIILIYSITLLKVSFTWVRITTKLFLCKKEKKP